MEIQTINPTTEKILKNYSSLSKEQLRNYIEQAVSAFEIWQKTDFEKRSTLMLKLANCLRRNAENYAQLMAEEMGKPITAGMAEIDKCVWACEHYAQEAENYLKPQIIKTEKQKSFVCYQPLGVVFGIMPWNFPFWQVFRFAIPNVMAGNVCLLKHATIATGSGQAIVKVFLEAGFPEFVFQHLLIHTDKVSDVIADPRVRAVTLTGSEVAGKIVAANAAKHLKKTVLELGGSDPYIVLEDADLDRAADCIVRARLNNSGQTCIAAKRAIVVDSVLPALLTKMQSKMRSYTIGDPLDPQVKLGPLARKDLREILHQQVLKSVAMGAKICLGGEIPQGKGYFYPATILTDVSPGMPAFDEELFGPVLAVISARDEEEAILLANQSHFGLGAAVFTRDILRGEHIAAYRLEAGSCFVNDVVASDPRLPFGGIKQSGFGRELAKEGILEFVNVKTVCIA